MTSERYGDIWVCTDCYFAHHYGWRAVAVDPAEGSTYPGPLLSGPIDDDEVAAYLTDGWTVQFFAGESDSPCDREPLSLIGEGFNVADNTCSNHEEQYDGAFDDGIPCAHCGQTGFENGITEFSWSACQGCGSTLGGSRHRLSLWKETSDA